MPYDVPPDSVMEVTIEATQDAQRIMSVFHYIFTGGAPLPDGSAALQQVLTALAAAGKLVDKWLACISDQIIDVRVYGQWITPDRFRYEPLPGPAKAGTVATNPLPVNVAAAITKFSQDASRHGIGTTHMPAVPESFVAASTLTVLGLNAYDALCVEIPVPVTLGGGNMMSPVLFNRLNPASSAVIDGAFPQTNSRVMRRRTVGVGA